MCSCICMLKHNKKEDYIDKSFHTKTWKNCYLSVIHPIPSVNLWPQFPKRDLLKPPKVIRQPRGPNKE